MNPFSSLISSSSSSSLLSEFFRYNDPTIELSRTDIQKHNNVEAPVSVADGEKLAMVIEFSLSSSTYATMALREMTKMDTSSAFMTTLMEKSKKERAETLTKSNDVDVVSTAEEMEMEAVVGK